MILERHIVKVLLSTATMLISLETFDEAESSTKWIHNKDLRMRNQYIGYYNWTPEEFMNLWNEAIFVFDTNTLLNIYRYKENTCNAFLNTLELVQDNAWIPDHVAAEFHKNRRGCIYGQEKAYDGIVETLKGSVATLEEKIKKIGNHKLLNTADIKDQFQKVIDEISHKVLETKQDHPNYKENDSVLDRITKIFDNRVGSPMEMKTLEVIYKEGEGRYERKVPPGYGDKKKNLNKYGDLVIWKALMGKAEKEKRPIVFITSDDKEDWWQIEQGKRIGPRPELIQEFYRQTKQLYYQYNPAPFIDYAAKHFEQDVADEAVLTEIRAVRDEQSKKGVKLVKLAKRFQFASPVEVDPWQGSLLHSSALIPSISAQRHLRNEHMASLSELESELRFLNEKIHAMDSVPDEGWSPEIDDHYDTWQQDREAVIYKVSRLKYLLGEDFDEEDYVMGLE